jgi:hypothetical protein
MAFVFVLMAEAPRSLTALISSMGALEKKLILGDLQE